MNKTLIGSLATIPFATVGFFALTGSANAAALIGEFQLNGGFTVPTGNSLVTLSSNALTFSPQPITPIALSAQTDSFKGFNTANIGNIISFSSPFQADNPFLDFGHTLLPGVIGLTPGDATSIIDGINTFTLQSASYGLKQSGANVAIDLALSGFFTSTDGTTSKGQGNLTFQVNNTNVTNVQTTLSSGGLVNNLAFSGGLFTTQPVPEPATLLGLGLVGAALATSRRQKV
ncbi:PEP-CTERM sorting domain-containing protein [Pleurocapsales cyanobacterium LEGE 06147]|nr:PEP-CTERM sorting domain-containing protein [Pleurocapsales cyanobacterium LEGE 06147]